MITQDAIKAALEVCAGATKGPGLWTADRVATREQSIDRFVKHFDLSIEETGVTCLHAVEVVDPKDANERVCLAFTGNGPKSAENARFVAGALDPVAGWEATLHELERAISALEMVASHVFPCLDDGGLDLAVAIENAAAEIRGFDEGIAGSAMALDEIQEVLNAERKRGKHEYIVLREDGELDRTMGDAEMVAHLIAERDLVDDISDGNRILKKTRAMMKANEAMRVLILEAADTINDPRGDETGEKVVAKLDQIYRRFLEENDAAG